MKRILLLTLLIPVCGGCIEMDVKLRESAPRPAIPASAIATPIIADQVNQDNARRMAQALWDEIEQEETAPVYPSQKR